MARPDGAPERRRRLQLTPRPRQYDESDVRIRPNPRGSRPRSKDRPAHDDAVSGFVTAVDRGRYTVLVDEGGGDERVVTSMKARELGRKGIAVGDRLGIVGDVGGGPDSLARIVRLEPRRSALRRTADDSDPIERVIVANADQLVIVTALADPEPRPRMIDRCLVAAYDAGMTPLLLLTKADLVDPEPFMSQYAPLGVRAVVTSRRRTLGSPPGGEVQPPRPGAAPSGPQPARSESVIEGLEELRVLLEGHVSVLIGHSGVGKSTLVNALVPGTLRATGGVNDVTGRGRHTSSSAVALRLPPVQGPSGAPESAGAHPGAPGWVVDTPGVRSFGLAHVAPERIISYFPDLEPGTAQCPRGCTHDEPECALDEWVAQGHAGPAGVPRLESLRRLLRARTADLDD